MRLGVAGAMVAGVYRPGDVGVDASSGRIAAVGLAGPGRGLAVPGLIDLQVNGFAGVDFQQAQADDYRPAAEALARSGVLAFQPTLITGAPGRMLAALEEAAKAQAHHGGARILGVHLEGPFLSPRRPGTHPVNLLRSATPALARQLLDAGPVTEITIAPELPGALRLIDLAVRRGVLVSLGHSDATAEHAHAAVDHGARMVTHVFDAVRRAHGAGVPLEAALGAATVTPAALFPNSDLDLLRPGDYADLVVPRCAQSAAGRKRWKRSGPQRSRISVSVVRPGPVLDLG